MRGSICCRRTPISAGPPSFARPLLCIGVRCGIVGVRAVAFVGDVERVGVGKPDSERKRDAALKAKIALEAIEPYVPDRAVGWPDELEITPFHIIGRNNGNGTATIW